MKYKATSIIFKQKFGAITLAAELLKRYCSPREGAEMDIHIMIQGLLS